MDLAPLCWDLSAPDHLLLTSGPRSPARVGVCTEFVPNLGLDQPRIHVWSWSAGQQAAQSRERGGGSGSRRPPDGMVGSGFDPFPSMHPTRSAGSGAGGLNPACRSGVSRDREFRHHAGDTHPHEGGRKTSITPSLGLPLAPRPPSRSLVPAAGGDHPVAKPLPTGCGVDPGHGVKAAGMRGAVPCRRRSSFPADPQVC